MGSCKLLRENANVVAAQNYVRLHDTLLELASASHEQQNGSSMRTMVPKEVVYFLRLDGVPMLYHAKSAEEFRCK